MSIERFPDNGGESPESVICGDILDDMTELAQVLRHRNGADSLMPQEFVPGKGIVSWFTWYEGLEAGGIVVRVTQQHAPVAPQGVEIDCNFEFNRGHCRIGRSEDSFHISVPRVDGSREKDHFAIEQGENGAFIIIPRADEHGVEGQLDIDDLEAYAALPSAALEHLRG